jgi:hypothetical protein
MQIAFSEETVNGRQWRRISSADAGTPDIVWTYDRGYMLVSTDEASIMRAIGVRDSAGSLIRSSRFQQQYPGGGNLHNSGFMWLDVSRVGEIAASMGQEVAGMAAGADPILVVLTGEADSLRWATRSRLTSLIFDLLLASPA